MEKIEASDKLIVALDCSEPSEAEGLLELLSPVVRRFKVGNQLFTAAGPAIVNMVLQKGCELFLDLKLHDIPSTVGRASRQITKQGVWMFNLHTLGGLEMMKEARRCSEAEAKNLGGKRPIILGVTVLTSMDEATLRSDLGIHRALEEEVLHLAGLAKEAGLDGVVASPGEIGIIRKSLGKEFIIVTPGIRPKGWMSDDQKRVATPREAKDYGADYIVVGRPIVRAEEPLRAAQEIIEEIGG